MSEDPLIGRVVAGQYEARSLLGTGGMGEVYAGLSASGEEVAIKFLRRELAADGEIVARFAREAKLAHDLRSDYIAAVLCAGMESDGRLWIVFERLFGETLEARIRREPLAFTEVQWIADHVLRGLADAHRHGVIHRDIKPANIFLETTSRARILDFGVSKRMRAEHGSSSTGLTAADEALGTANYMAPEQMKSSASVTPRADLYATGAVIFRMLSGRLPFEAESYVLLEAHKRHHDPPTLEVATGSPWPDAVEAFLARMMARDPGDRFESADAARAAWEIAATSLDGHATRALNHAADGAAAETASRFDDRAATRRGVGKK